MSDITVALILLVMVFISGSCVREDSPAPQSAANTPREWPAPVEGLSCAIALAADRFPAGAPVVLSVGMRNTSDRVQTAWNRGTWPNHKVIVTDSRGIEPPLTEQGRLTRAAFGQAAQRKSVPIPLQPGQTIHPTVAMDLTTLFQMSPGQYQVEVEYADLEGPALRSNRVMFEIR